MRGVWVLTVLCTAVTCSIASVSHVFTANENTKTVTVTEVKKQQNKVLKPTPKAVSLFDKFVREEVKKCKLVSTVFDMEKRITREEFEAAKFYLVTALTADANSKSPADKADTATKYITISQGRLTSDFMLTIYADAMGRYLYSTGVLNDKNAKKYAKSFVQVTKDIAKKILNTKYPRTSATVLPVAYKTFLEKLKFSKPSKIAKIVKDYGLEWKYQKQIGNDPAPSKYKLPPPVYKGPNPLIKECDKVCKISDKSVDKFYSAFKKAVKASKTLRDLFTVAKSMNKYEVSRGVEYMVQYNTQKGGFKDAGVIADFSARYIRDVKKWEPWVFEAVQAKGLAKYLRSKKLLNCKNAKEMAKDFARTLEKRAKAVVDKEFPKSKLVSIVLGSRDFLYKYDVYDPQKFTYFKGNEWRCANSYGNKA